MSDPRRILVVANETVVSRKLVDLIEAHAGEGEVEVTVVAPINQPRQGFAGAISPKRQLVIML